MPKQVIHLVDLEQPFCNKTWGSTTDAGVCVAHLSIHQPQKCFNTRKTCPVPANYDVATYAIIPGVSGNYISTPDSVANSLTADLDVRVKMAPADWTPAAELAFFTKFVSTGNQCSWALQLESAGTLRLHWSPDGTTGATIAVSSSVAVGAVNGSTLWVRATLDVNNGAAGRDVKFYTSVDYDERTGTGAWTQLGSTLTSGGVTSVFDSTSPLEIGSNRLGTSSLWAGRAFAAELRNGIDGPVVAQFSVLDAAVDGSTTVTSSKTGEVWTVNQSGAVGARAAIVLGYRKLRFVSNQTGARAYNGVTSIRNLTVEPGTLNLAGMDGRSEDLLGQREEVSISLDNDRGDDDAVDKYRLERQTGVSSTKYLSLPGVAGNYASTPDSAANSIVGDLTIRALITLDSWILAGNICVVGKWGAAGQRSYKLEVLTDGKLRLAWSNDGTAILTADSTVPVPVAGGVPTWIMAALQVNSGAANHSVVFAYGTNFNPGDPTASFNPNDLVGLGSAVAAAGVTSIFNSTAALTVGAEADGSSERWTGRVFYADVDDSFNFSTTAPNAKFDPQAQAPGTTSFAAPSTGETWTINQSGSTPAALVALAPGYDPYTRGTRWGKFLSRNPFHVGNSVRVYHGEVGQAFGAMTPRYYLTKSIDRPKLGTVSWVLRDQLDRITSRKATCPFISTGELFADITAVATSFTLSPAGIGNAEYPSANFYVAIESEVIFVVSRAGDVCSSATRGALDTVAAAHKDEDLVQLCAVFTSMSAKDISYSLLVTYAGLPTTWIDSAQWTSASAAVAELYTARIAKPTPVSQLIGELQEQAGFSLIPNLETARIDFIATRPAVSAAVIDDESWVVKGTMRAQRLDLRRVSHCLIRYGQKDPTKDLEDDDNFHSRFLFTDLASAGATQYGTMSLKKMYSRWIPQFGRTLAEAAAARPVGMFRDPPWQAEFRVSAARAIEVGLSLGSQVTMRVAELEDFYGGRQDQTHTVVRMARDHNRDEVALRTIETRFGAAVAKTVFIGNDSFGINFRTEYNKLFLTPVAGDTVRCVILSGIFVGATGVGGAIAFDVGTWPAGVTVIVEILGVFEGHGGIGGQGGNARADTPLGFAGQGGFSGGPAFVTTQAVTVTGTGQILGGWGGGGGGGGDALQIPGFPEAAGGGGGGGGRGIPGGPGGGVGSAFFGSGQAAAPVAGSSGSRDAQGTGGAGEISANFGGVLAQGGSGGPGNAAGGAGSFSGGPPSVNSAGAGGAAGARGNAITGNSFITFSSWTGTVDGPVV